MRFSTLFATKVYFRSARGSAPASMTLTASLSPAPCAPCDRPARRPRPRRGRPRARSREPRAPPHSPHRGEEVVEDHVRRNRGRLRLRGLLGLGLVLAAGDGEREDDEHSEQGGRAKATHRRWTLLEATWRRHLARTKRVPRSPPLLIPFPALWGGTERPMSTSDAPRISNRHSHLQRSRRSSTRRSSTLRERLKPLGVDATRSSSRRTARRTAPSRSARQLAAEVRRLPTTGR